MTSIFTETPLSEEELIQYLCTSVVQMNKSVSLSLI